MARTWTFAAAIAGCVLLLSVCPTTLRAQEPPGDLQQLVAPVALYPDELLAEILAAATYPSQVDDAARWLQQNASLTTDQMAGMVDGMDWDPSVKALTEFPMVLANMDQNLSWTSALGDAYYNEPDDVMDAVQQLREQALAAGTLQSNAEVTVSQRDGIIVIEPANASTVYVPSYDCWNAYGAPIRPWPGFFFVRGLEGGPRIAWTLSFRLGGIWGRVNWGWYNWAFDWGRHRVAFQRQDYVSHSPSVVSRPPQRGEPAAGGRAPFVPRTGQRPAERPQPPAGRGAVEPRPGGGRAPVAVPREQQNVAAPKPAAPPVQPANPKRDRGFPQAQPTAPPSGTRTSALSGFNHGGTASDNSTRGQVSLGVRAAPPPQAPQRQASPPARQSQPEKKARGRGRGGV